MVGVVIGVVVIVGGSAAGSNASPTGDQAAIQKCQAITPVASEYGTITGVLRGETSSAGAVANWQESRARRGPISSFRALSAATPVTVCIFSGQFATPTGPLAPDGSPKTIPNALRLLVYGNDKVVFDSAGNASGMSPETPSDPNAPNA